ncbi:MAG TPA: biopolymer transporter ExbD [Chitinophagaceae bacterium]|nr:biopolymer transporter ExbD [Chitinophagaceae bacterium]
MPKIKIPRKSTNIDMTAMCDVAFLLLSFFILATQFKPAEALEVQTPTSVQTTVAEMKNVVMITIDKSGRVFYSLSDDLGAKDNNFKAEVIEAVNEAKNLNLTAQEKAMFSFPGYYIGVPFSQLKSALQKSPEQLAGMNLPGIPVTDTLNNELQVWMRATVDVMQGKTMNLLVKGDNESKYPTFKAVMDAFKKNELFKFKMVTNPEGVPPGSELAKKARAESH